MSREIAHVGTLRRSGTGFSGLCVAFSCFGARAPRRAGDEGRKKGQCAWHWRAFALQGDGLDFRFQKTRLATWTSSCYL